MLNNMCFRLERTSAESQAGEKIRRGPYIYAKGEALGYVASEGYTQNCPGKRANSKKGFPTCKGFGADTNPTAVALERN